MSEQPLPIACVGGSVTFGLGLPNRRQESYPAVLAGLLGEGFRVRNFGYSGAAVGRGTNEPYWQTPSMTAVERFEPKLILLMMGINDAQFANRESLPSFESDFTDLIAHFEAFPSSPRVVLLSSTPVFDPLPEIDIEALDRVVRPTIERIAALQGLPLVEVYEPLRGRPEWFPDNLHPNAEGARVVAECVAAVLRESVLGASDEA